jgi:DNA topoisomerase-1
VNRFLFSGESSYTRLREAAVHRFVAESPEPGRRWGESGVKQLIHKGILIPRYEARGFHVTVRERRITLTPEQEEMAWAWVKKLGTEYVEDRVFVANFFEDFSHCLGLRGTLSPQDFDFSEIQQHMEAEKKRKDALTKEEKKRQAASRKQRREAKKEAYGYAFVDGKRVEIANYTAEPSSIFMGRGRHPLRGKWKQGPKSGEVILNLSPDAPMPDGAWKARVWRPESMWVAKWRDRLGGRMKYVWLSDAFQAKQQRDIEKFDQAKKLKKHMRKVRRHIRRNLTSSDPLRRKIATVCYLIDALKLRVGDEKDTDEADTVGATTLKPEHITLSENGSTTFDFLGKDSIHWRLEASLPRRVLQNIRRFSADAESAIFKGVRSDNVSGFLSEVMPGLTAKVFRTYHASKVVEESLKASKISRDDPTFMKMHTAKMANLEAAKTCNHKKKAPKNWETSLTKMGDRLTKLKARREEIRVTKTRKEETKIRRLKKADERIKKLETRIELKKATKEYNLNTALKSYIDPRIYYHWGKQVEYDWQLCYSKALQRKYQWVETSDS